jgi:pimeloyl-ACP methyl ester carboxylesterase
MEPFGTNETGGEAMGTFVLVHGAWGGGWAWRPTVGKLLRDAGHEAFTPTLTGLGERAHLASPEVNLETHIQGIVNVIEFENLCDVVLMGHSYGGMVITGVADRIPERLAALVYVDAFVPADGQSLADLTGEGAERMEARARADGDGWRLPPGPVSPDATPEHLAWVTLRRSTQPVKTFTQPVHLTGGGAELPRTYVYCTNPPGDAFTRIATRLRDDSAWKVVDFPTSHNVHYTMARELADLLLASLLGGRTSA